ncbi:hypothetical protein [Histophilus somni]|uniref:hypothetical protein n=1 Tax=Histophilus somni TaxID=731 RepID=UPI0002E18356|nr:hypothetical protein [Histophilus somni]QQF85669.1 hypothetical protein JFL55_07765 [Histophilus somni]QQJ90522.1 hypothetical protein JFJ84_02600 [Histophilus somni]
MANSNTEHSKKLRAQTAKERNQRLKAEGKVRQISMLINSELADQFDVIAKEQGKSRPEVLKMLIELYQQKKQN